MQLQRSRSRRRCRAHTIWINEMLAAVALLLPLLALANFSCAQATGKCKIKCIKNKKYILRKESKGKTVNKAGTKENTIFLHAFWLSLHFRVRGRGRVRVRVLFVSLSICVPLARSLARSLFLSQFLFAALFVALAPVSPCQFGQVVACSLAHSPISLSLCTRCTLRSLLYLFACSLSRLLRFLALPLLVLLLLRSLNFFCRRQRSLSFRFIPFCLTEWTNEHTHSHMHACMYMCMPYDSWHCYTCSHIILLSTSCGFAVVFCGPPIIISPTCQSFLPR